MGDGEILEDVQMGQFIVRKRDVRFRVQPVVVHIELLQLLAVGVQDGEGVTCVHVPDDLLSLVEQRVGVVVGHQVHMEKFLAADGIVPGRQMLAQHHLCRRPRGILFTYSGGPCRSRIAHQ